MACRRQGRHAMPGPLSGEYQRSKDLLAVNRSGDVDSGVSLAFSVQGNRIVSKCMLAIYHTWRRISVQGPAEASARSHHRSAM